MLSLVRKLILLMTLTSLHVFAQDSDISKLIKEETTKLTQIISASTKLDEKAIKKYISENYEGTSSEYQDLVIRELKKVSSGRRAETLAKILLTERKFIKAGEACYSVTNQCLGQMVCDFPLASNPASAFEKCLTPKEENQACSPEVDICLSGSCKKITRLTDINTCTTEKNSCKRDSECCSNSCDKKTKTCNAQFTCSKCFSVGQKPGKKGECCESLFKNSRGVCSPILPAFSNIFQMLNWIIPEANAAENSAELKGQVEATKTKLQALLESNNVNSSKSQTYINSISSSIETCNSKPISTNYDHGQRDYPRKDCFEALQVRIGAEYNHQIAVQAKVNEATKLLDDYEPIARGNPKHPQHTQEAYDQFEAPFKQAMTNCINRHSSLGTNQDSRLSEINKCVDATKDNINDAIIEADYLLTLNGGESTAPDYNLFNGAQAASPLFKDVQISDMRACRVNLFGDYLAAQPNSYFEIMMMMFAMDYTTGGKDEGDYFHIKSQYNTEKRASGNMTGTSNQTYNWNVQTNAMRGYDLERFDPGVVGKGRALWDEFDYSVGEGALNEITNYLANLPEEERKIFLHLYYNGKVDGATNDRIINYYMKQDDSYISNFSGNNPKAGAGRYNIRDVVRFEAIKYKHSMYKLYSILKKRSLEMMCRCVDTVGPMEKEGWLESDVEANYLANCNGLGKYDTFVVDNDKEVCDENGANCKKVSDKDYIDTIKQKQADGLEEVGGTSAISENSVGKKIVNNGDYNIVDRQNDYFVNTLDRVTSCIGSGECSKTSRYSEFVKQNKVSFTEIRKETAKGDGLDFSLFLRDMTLMKIKAIEDATLQNINHGTALFEYTVQWLKEYNFTYLKYEGERYTKSKKCLYPVCFILEKLKFLGSFINKLLAASVNLSSLGFVIGGDFNIDLDPPRGPENICGPRTKSRWKKLGVTIGKKYKIKCMKFHARANDVCNKVFASGSCTRNSYVKREGGAAIRLIDPFLPDMSSFYNTSYSSKTKIPYNSTADSVHNYHELTDDIANFYRSHAAGYFMSSLVSVDNGSDTENADRERMAKDFGQYAYRFHFFAPKVSKLDYYITPGLIPYFELLISKLNNYMGQSLANLSASAAYALQMHNYYYNVNEGLNASTQIERKETHQGIPSIVLTNDFGKFTNWLSGFSTAGNGFNSLLSDDGSANSTLKGKIRDGVGSGTNAISQVSKGVSKQIERNERRIADRKLMAETLAKRGKSGDMDRLQKLADKRSSEHSSVLSSLTDSFINSTFGKDSSAARRRARNAQEDEATKDKLAGQQEGLTQEAINPDANKSSSSAAAKSSSRNGEKSKEEISVLTFDNLDEAQGLFDMDNEQLVMLGDKKMTAGQLKNYIAGLKDSDKKQNDIRKQDDQWERDGVSLFQLISKRYKISAFPKVLK